MEIDRLLQENLKLKTDLLEARDLVLDLFSQACRTTGGYDHQCMGTYEEVQRYLLECRMVDKEECVRP